MAVIVVPGVDGREAEPVTDERPFPVQVLGPPAVITSAIPELERVLIPGIATASIYTAADAFGTAFEIVVPVEGTISNVIFYDLDNEGIDKELLIFNQPFTATADHDAIAVSDADLLNMLGVAYINTWTNFANNQVGLAIPALSYHAPYQSTLFFQLFTRGADTIAVLKLPSIRLVVI